MIIKVRMRISVVSSDIHCITSEGLIYNSVIIIIIIIIEAFLAFSFDVLQFFTKSLPKTKDEET